MTTLEEIEQAIEQLPIGEQKQLVSRLDMKLRRRVPRSQESPEEWLARLDRLRKEARFTPQPGIDTQSILDEMREDR